jgi:hypothetical protein
MSEFDDAMRMANEVLGDAARDPQDDMSKMARQLMRAVERAPMLAVRLDRVDEAVRCLIRGDWQAADKIMSGNIENPGRVATTDL